MSSLEVRELSKPEEFHEAVEVQKSAWEMRDYREAAPAHLLRALADNGGLVLGAFLNGRLVGVSYGWPAGAYFYSHATGVSKNVKYKGIGFRLKVAQRGKVLEKYGLKVAKWTFDPLQALNSRFNLVKLGIATNTYLIDYYGEIRDSINLGLGSDRVKAEWYLTSKRVLNRLDGKLRSDYEALRIIRTLNHCIALESEGLKPGRPKLDCEEGIVLLEIPPNISGLREKNPLLPRMWRLATREVYAYYLSSGYYLVDSLRVEERRYNVLWRAPLSMILDTTEPWRQP